MFASREQGKGEGGRRTESRFRSHTDTSNSTCRSFVVVQGVFVEEEEETVELKKEKRANFVQL